MISDQLNGKVHKNEQLSFEDVINLFGCALEKNPSIYIYEFCGEGKTMRGIWAMTDLAATATTAIKRHEDTVSAKVASLKTDKGKGKIEKSPILLVYQHNDLESLIDLAIADQQPMESEWSQLGHFLYQIADTSLIDRFCVEFAKLEQVYLADGHHRLEAAYALQKTVPQQISSLFVSAGSISIAAFHRLIQGIDITKEALMEMLEQYYYISKIPNNKALNPDRKNRMGLYFAGEWYQLDLKPDLADLAEMPDTAILQEMILKPVLGITNPKEDTRLSYFPDGKWSQFLAQLGTSTTTIGFTLHPMEAEEFIAVAKKGRFLPPKSTWIAPKIPQGFMATSPVAILAKGEKVNR
ncbi:hypothetical protein ASE74_13685 [Pedobacter sp. Leaf216]|nr:hypothetical protein ASE74_13685 [Pedobacter sp. Leaf216]